ncbi:MAG: hypothetical protein AAF982_05730 [Pseudomonadota bacterium]
MKGSGPPPTFAASQALTKVTWPRALGPLAEVGATRRMKRMKRGRATVITGTSKGAFRGSVNTHAQGVECDELDVIDGANPMNAQ